MTVDVVLFTTEEPLYLPRYLEPVFDEHGSVFGEVVLAPPSTSTAIELHRQLRMFGPTNFLRVGRRFARERLLDALPTGLVRPLTGRYHGVTTLAAAHGIPVRWAEDLSDPSFVEHLAARDPDVSLSIICGQKLPPAVLDIPSLAINLHGSLLPQYRGRATAFWPLYHGDEKTGVTAHLMTDSFDAGAIVEQRAFRVDDGDSMHDVYRKLADTGAGIAVDLLDQLRGEGIPRPSELETRPNPTTPDDYYTLPTPTERREFLRRGNEFI